MISYIVVDMSVELDLDDPELWIYRHDIPLGDIDDESPVTLSYSWFVFSSMKVSR